MLALIVDDNDDIRYLLRHVLAMDGFAVTEAPSGPDALRALQDGLRPDVVVLDVQMPDVDGWDTLRAIRADPGTAEVPVVMCTVKGRPVDAEHGWSLGCDGYVSKPFDIDDLRAVIRGAIERTPDRRAQARADALGEVHRRIESG